MSSELSLELQKAIAAAHAGDKNQARNLADQVIQDDPENENALYLMSALVETNEEREAYLSQILIVNPEHAGAQKYLAHSDEPQSDSPGSDELESVETAIEYEEEIVVAATDLAEYDQLDETIVVGAAAAVAATEVGKAAQVSESVIDEEVSDAVPDWLLDEEEEVVETEIGEEGELEPAEIDDVPDWLTDEPSLLAEESQSDGLAAEKQESAAEEGVESLEQLVEQEPIEVPAPTQQRKPAAKKGLSDRVLSIILIVLVLIAVIIVVGIIILAIAPPILS